MYPLSRTEEANRYDNACAIWETGAGIYEAPWPLGKAMMKKQTLPRVTEVLKGAGLIETAWFTPEGRERGTAVHLACRYLDEGNLDEASIDPAIAAFLAAYKQFRQNIGVQPWQWIECPMKDPMGIYCGTSDRIAVIRPRCLYDIKTGAHQRWHAVQTAAYVNMLPDPYAYRRFGLYLKPDGQYSVREFPRSEYQRDLNVFMAALTLHNWRNEHGK